MAKGQIAGEGLRYKARLDIAEAIKNAQDLKKELASIGIGFSKSFDQKKLVEYNSEILKVKQDSRELAKIKSDQMKSDRVASLATQRALREERLLIRERNEEEKKRRNVDFGDSKAEVDAYNKSTSLGGSRVASSGRDEYIRLLNQDLQDGKISIADYRTELLRLSQTQEQTAKTSKNLALSKKELDKIALQEKFNSQQSTEAIKNSIREMNAAKGSIEQRRAALIRLTKTYDGLNAAERNSASGQRLKTIVSGLTDQLKNLEGETGRAQRNVGNYTGGISKAFSALRNLASFLPGIGLSGIFLLGYDGVMKLIEGLDLFKMSVSDAKKAGQHLGEAITGGDYSNAIKNVSELRLNVDLAKKGFVDKGFVVKQYNSTIGATSGQVKSLDEVERGLVSNADNYIKMTLYKAAANLSLQQAAQKAVEAQKQFLEDEQTLKNAINSPKFNDGEANGSQEFVARGIASAAVARKKAADKAIKQEQDIAKTFLSNAAETAKAMGGVLGKDFTEKQQKVVADTAVNARNDLQRRINELTKKGLDKQLDADHQEIEAVKDKYAKIREEVDKFNNDPHNKKKGLRVDGGNLVSSQSTEIDAVRDKQAADKLKTDLDKQKKLYEEFEQFKSDFGIAKAKERFKGQIDTEITFLQKLEQEREKITDPQKSKGSSEDEVKAEKQLKVLNEQIQAETLAEQKKYDTLLKQFMGYSQKRELLVQQREVAIRIETEKGDAIGLENAKNYYDKEISDLDIANMQKLDSYKNLFTGIESMSKANANKLIADTKAAFEKSVKEGKIVDPAEIAKIRDYLDGLGKTIKKGAGQELIEVANTLDGIISSIADADSEFGKMLHTVSNVVGQLGNIKKGIGDFNKDGASGTDKLMAGLGILGAGVSIFKSVFSLFDRSQQREEQASYARDLQNKQTEALNRALERQVALLDDVYGTDRIKKSMEAIKLANDNAEKYQEQLASRFLLTGNKKLDDLIAKENTGTLEKNGIDRLFFNNSLKILQRLPTDLEALRALIGSGVLDANTETIVQNLIKAKETAEQLVNNLRAEAVGSTLSEIADDFISTLTDGTKDFGKTFEQTIQKSILNGFKGELIRKQLQSFYEQFAKLSEGGLTSEEIEALRKSYLSASEKAKSDLEALSKATGINLNGDASGTVSQSGATGIARAQLTEETGQRIDGIMRAQYDATKQTNVLLAPIGKTIGDFYLLAKGNFDVQARIEANTLRTANNTDLLNNKLDAIIANTKPVISRGI